MNKIFSLHWLRSCRLMLLFRFGVLTVYNGCEAIFCRLKIKEVLVKL